MLNLHDVLKWVIPETEECRLQASELMLASPDQTAVQVAHSAVKTARRWAAAAGATTGLAASPITMLPAAVADMAAMLRIEGHMAGTIAALLDPASLDDETAFRRDIIRVVFPGAVSQALRKLGVRVGENAAKSLIEKYAGRALMKEIAEQAAKRLGVRLTRKAVAAKAIPLVGAGIGAAWNWLEIQAIGRRAIHYHAGTEEAPRVPIRRKVASWVRSRTSPKPDGAKSDVKLLP